MRSSSREVASDASAELQEGVDHAVEPVVIDRYAGFAQVLVENVLSSAV